MEKELYLIHEKGDATKLYSVQKWSRLLCVEIILT